MQVDPHPLRWTLAGKRNVHRLGISHCIAPSTALNATHGTQAPGANDALGSFVSKKDRERERERERQKAAAAYLLACTSARGPSTKATPCSRLSNVAPKVLPHQAITTYRRHTQLTVVFGGLQGWASRVACVRVSGLDETLGLSAVDLISLDLFFFQGGESSYREGEHDQKRNNVLDKSETRALLLLYFVVVTRLPARDSPLYNLLAI
jgi:hypothetical protein